MTLERRKRPGEAWETSVGGTSDVTSVELTSSGFAVLGNGEWGVFFITGTGELELLGKTPAGIECRLVIPPD